MYHIVCLAKYRRAVITNEVDKKLKGICLEIEKRYEIKFLETGAEKGRVHFLVQSVPAYSPAGIVQKIKGKKKKKIFETCPEVKKWLWGGGLWTREYYAGTVEEHGNEETIARYVSNQGRKHEEYEKIYENKQLELFS
jgi:REP element-mobilizing transposase RayT